MMISDFEFGLLQGTFRAIDDVAATAGSIVAGQRRDIVRLQRALAGLRSDLERERGRRIAAETQLQMVLDTPVD